MTDSDVRVRPPDAPLPGPEWKKIPGVKDYYEASHRGLIRSLPHTTNGRDYEGTDPLKPRLDGDGYEVVNVTLASGERRHGMSVARLVLQAHAWNRWAPGLQACHGPGGQRDNRWPENLRWDTDEANRADWRRDNPPQPKPPKVCPRCGGEHDSPGRRCQPCLDDLGRQSARQIAGGEDDLDALAKDLGYPSGVGLFRLAVRRGGLRCTVAPVVLIEECNAAVSAARAASHPPSRLRRVLFRRGPSRQNSDAK
jgi:hypothetical protein